MVVAADDRLDFCGAQQPPRPGAAAQSNAPPALFLNLDAAHASAKEIPERGFNSNRPWPPPEPSRWDGRRPSLSRAEIQVKASSKQIFDLALRTIFKNVYDYTRLTLVR